MVQTATSQLSVLIVEDSYTYAIELQRLCERLGHRVLGIVEDSSEAFERIIIDRPGLILMDIRIKGKMNGVEIGSKIKHLGIPIIYLTSYADEKYQQLARQSNMLGYLVKPINEVTLESVLKMSVRSMPPQQDEVDMLPDEDGSHQRVVFMKRDRVFHKVKVSQIAYVSSEGNYCRIVVGKDNEFLLRCTLGNITNKLPMEDFIQVHRSHLVRRGAIERIDPSNRYVQIFGIHIPVSRHKLEELLRHFPLMK